MVLEWKDSKIRRSKHYSTTLSSPGRARSPPIIDEGSGGEGFGSPGGPRKAQMRPERPRGVPKGPEEPRKAQSSPERLRGPERPRGAQKGPRGAEPRTPPNIHRVWPALARRKAGRFQSLENGTESRGRTRDTHSAVSHVLLCVSVPETRPRNRPKPPNGRNGKNKTDLNSFPKPLQRAK